MRAHIRTTILGTITALALALTASPCAGAQSEASATSGVTVEKLVTAIAKRTGKKFLIDPRVRAEVTVIGQEATSVDYATLLLILHIHGFPRSSRAAMCK
jgi:type II secretory pathway component GspD/PulD (secretin)